MVIKLNYKLKCRKSCRKKWLSSDKNYRRQRLISKSTFALTQLQEKFQVALGVFIVRVYQKGSRNQETQRRTNPQRQSTQTDQTVATDVPKRQHSSQGNSSHS